MRESIFSTVLFGKPHDVSLWTWVKLICIEMYVGENLLDMLSNTASFNTGATFDGESNGLEARPQEFIPATFFNKLVRRHIEELIEIKYSNQYSLLKVVKRNTTELGVHELYKLNNQKLYLLTELRLAYNTMWVAVNLVADLLVYLATNDLSLTLLTGAIIEFIRRFKI
ncbi:hypothetical protein J7G20_004340 [Vibrio parahaemolyticus]|nr:hypothetical protein [Vibrio parahaemolyticus]